MSAQDEYWYVIIGYQGIITALPAEGIWHCRLSQILAGPFSYQEIAEDTAKSLTLEFMLGEQGESEPLPAWDEGDFAILSAGEIVEDTGYTCAYCDNPAVVLDDSTLLCQAHSTTAVYPAVELDCVADVGEQTIIILANDDDWERDCVAPQHRLASSIALAEGRKVADERDASLD